MHYRSVTAVRESKRKEPTTRRSVPVKKTRTSTLESAIPAIEENDVPSPDEDQQIVFKVEKSSEPPSPAVPESPQHDQASSSLDEFDQSSLDLLKTENGIEEPMEIVDDVSAPGHDLQDDTT